MVSVSVSYFNNGVWKNRFLNPSVQYCVAMCLHSDKHTKKHTLLILGDHRSGAFEVSEKMFRESRALWNAHDQPHLPLYTLGTTTVVISDDSDTETFYGVSWTSPTKPQKKSPRRRAQQSQGKHGHLRLDLDRLDSGKQLRRRNRLKEDLRPEQEFKQRFEVAERLLCRTREAFTWRGNSCHLDCWLMEEFAFFFELSLCPSFASMLSHATNNTGN